MRSGGRRSDFTASCSGFLRPQLLLFLKGFTESERNKLAMLTGILLANGNLSASILNSLFNENLVKEGERL